jgi:hypothetical protein
MQTLILYSTLGCHLCELACNEIEPSLLKRSLCLNTVDIADDPALLEAFGTRIPVLFYPKNQAYLYWPFDRNTVEDFLAVV